jgi:hypothetical protein
MNDCPCKECNPKKIRDYFVYLMPASIIVFGCLQFSIGTILAGIIISALLKKIKKLEEKVKNCECWY